MDSASGFLAGFFFRGQRLLLCRLLLFSDQNFRWRPRGAKCLHLSSALLRNETEVRWHSAGSTMTSIVGEVTQTYS